MKKPNYLVVKHNNLIEARYSLTLCEQKLVTAIAMMIKPDDVDFREYYLDVRTFIDMMEVSGNAYHALVEQRATAIMKKPIKIPLNNKDFVVCKAWFRVEDFQRLLHTFRRRRPEKSVLAEP